MPRNKFLIVLIASVLLLIFTIRGAYGNVTLSNVPNQRNPLNPSFEAPHERSRIIAMMSLVETGSFKIPREVFSYATPDLGIRNGNMYSLYPVGVPLVIIPLYLLGSFFNLNLIFAYATTGIVATLAAYVMFLILQRIFHTSIKTALAISFAMLFGTIIWPYSITIYQHTYTVFLLLLFFYLAGTKYSGKYNFLLLTATLAVALFFDYTNIILFLPLIVYASYKNFKKVPTRMVAPIVLIFIAALPIAISNHLVYGDWYQMSNTLTNLKFYTAGGPEQEVLPVSFYFNVFQIPNHAIRLLFSTERGLFVYSPILILGLLGIGYGLKKFRAESLAALGVIVCTLGLYSYFKHPFGDWAFGPRYLIPTIPFLMIFAALWLEHYRKKITPFIFSLFFAVSSAIALLGAITSNLVPNLRVVGKINRNHANVLTNVDLLLRDHSGSFFYNTVLRPQLPFIAYYFILLALSLGVFVYIYFQKENKAPKQ